MKIFLNLNSLAVALEGNFSKCMNEFSYNFLDSFRLNVWQIQVDSKKLYKSFESTGFLLSPIQNGKMLNFSNFEMLRFHLKTNISHKFENPVPHNRAAFKNDTDGFLWLHYSNTRSSNMSKLFFLSNFRKRKCESNYCS